MEKATLILGLIKFITITVIYFMLETIKKRVIIILVELKGILVIKAEKY
ncbi:hypothetical protein ACF5W4_07500 [Bacillota bacterium Lsc_1132]